MVEVFDVIYMAVSFSVMFCTILLFIIDINILQDIGMYLLVIQFLNTSVALSVRYLKELLDGVRHYD